jgi:putative membrane protein
MSAPIRQTQPSPSPRSSRPTGVPRWFTPRAALGAAIVTVVAAVSPPVTDAATRHLSVHMIQHVVLVGVCAPLLALGARAPRRPIPLGPTLAATLILQTIALITWHLPAPFDAAERSHPLHAAEHLTLVLSAAALWWTAIRAGGPAGWGAGALAVFLGSFPMTTLGLGLMLARTPWYTTYPDRDDQQLAGVVMWSGGGTLALVGVVALGVGWVHQAQHR